MGAKHVQFFVGEETLRRAHQMAASKGLSLTDVMRGLLSRWISGEIRHHG